MTNLLPFIRWAGGKRRQAVDLAARCIIKMAPSGRYLEPFLGGGAVALAMPRGIPLVLSDVCKPLGHLWFWIQREPRAVAEYAAGYGEWNTPEGFTMARLEHNAEPYSDDDWRPSARFLWLMHASFNGLYRENSTGLYNVPFGKRQAVNVPSADRLLGIANFLNAGHAEIYSGADFESILDYAERGSVTFIDPPYDGEGFTGYSKTRFTADDQERLFEACGRAINRGVHVVATNADTPLIRKLYRQTLFTLEEYTEERMIAANAEARVPARCLIMVSK